MDLEKLIAISKRWEKGESPTEKEDLEVYNSLPELVDTLCHYMNGLANIADTDISATQLRHMASRYLGRPTNSPKSDDQLKGFVDPCDQLIVGLGSKEPSGKQTTTIVKARAGNQ